MELIFELQQFVFRENETIIQSKIKINGKSEINSHTFREDGIKILLQKFQQANNSKLSLVKKGIREYVVIKKKLKVYLVCIGIHREAPLLENEGHSFLTHYSRPFEGCSEKRHFLSFSIIFKTITDFVKLSSLILLFWNYEMHKIKNFVQGNDCYFNSNM